MNYIESELKTKHGIDKLRLMLHAINLLDMKTVSEKRFRKNFNKIKSFVVQQIKRGITAKEELDLATGLFAYLKTEPQTNERMSAMEYLFEAKFLN